MPVLLNGSGAIKGKGAGRRPAVRNAKAGGENEIANSKFKISD